MAANNSTTSNALAVASGTLSVVSALAEATNKGSSLTELGKQLIRWLARERLYETEFNYCASLTQDTAHPNEYGLSIRQEIQAANQSTRNRIAGLTLAVPGSVGRAMAFDPSLCWMVTTVAVLMKYHDLPFATKVICYMALDKGGHDYGVDYPYDVKRTRIAPVVGKIVDSIALNVVNTGKPLRGLPKSLCDLCNHSTDDCTFSAVVMSIQRNQGNMLMDCNALFGDIVVWLLAHYGGTIEVSIAGRVLYREKLGLEPFTIMILVHGQCQKAINDRQCNLDTYRRRGNTIRLSVNFNGVSRTVVDAEPRNFKGTTPCTRRGLYDTSNISDLSVTSVIRLNNHYTPLNPSELSDIQLVAQTIARWMLDLPLESDDDPRGLCFRVDFKKTDIGRHAEVEVGRRLTIGDLFQRWPTIGHFNFGKIPLTMAVFTGQVRKQATSRSVFDNQGERMSFGEDAGPVPDLDVLRLCSLNEIVEQFPPIVTMLEGLRPRCDCRNCTKRGPVGDGKPGCTREIAIEMLFTLIAHSIADGFGARDVSGMSTSKDMASGVHRLLNELTQDGIVIWRTWFSVATSVALGCTWDDTKLESNEGASEVVAAQYGSLVAAARWIDLSTEQKITGCFGFVIAEGNLEGITADFAVVQLERTMKPPNDQAEDYWVFGDSEGTPKETNEAPDSREDIIRESLTLVSGEYDGEDDIEAAEGPQPEVLTILVTGTKICYRLLIVVKLDSLRRIIDPTDLVWSLYRSEEVTPCDHNPRTCKISISEQKSLSRWSFMEILGKWRSINQAFDLDTNQPAIVSRSPAPQNTVESTYITRSCNSRLKYNIVLALSPNGCILMNPGCCVKCALVKVGEKTRINSRRLVARNIEP